jgi:hypothetical protein
MIPLAVATVSPMGLLAIAIVAPVSGDTVAAARALSTLLAIAALGAVTVVIAASVPGLAAWAAPILSKRRRRQDEQQRHRRHSEGRHAPCAA